MTDHDARQHIEVLKELRADCNPEGADPYGRMMVAALDYAIAALAHPAPAATGEGVAVDPIDLARWLHQKLVSLSRKDYDSPRVVMDLRMVCGMLAPLYTTPAQQGGAVTEAMVRRAIDAFARVPADPTSDTLDTDLMRAALNAALNPGGEGNG